MNEVDEVRKEMARIRRELHTDVAAVVGGAGRVFDWRSYVRDYPWLLVGVAFGVGYFAVPRRSKAASTNGRVSAEDLSPKALATAVKQVARAAAPAVEEKPRRKGVFGHIWGLAWPIAVQAAQSYASYMIEDALGRNRPNGPAPTGAPPWGPPRRDPSAPYGPSRAEATRP